MVEQGECNAGIVDLSSGEICFCSKWPKLFHHRRILNQTPPGMVAEFLNDFYCIVRRVGFVTHHCWISQQGIHFRENQFGNDQVLILLM